MSLQPCAAAPMRVVDAGTGLVRLDQDDADSYFPPRMKRGNDFPWVDDYQLTGNVFLIING
jgi:hypothetical protein